MKKIVFTILSVFIFAGCTDDLTSLNVDSKNPTVVSSSALFTNAQRTLARTLASSNVNNNTFRLFVQYWQETTYTGESRYDLQSRSIPDNIWNAFYRELKDFNESKSLITKDIADVVVQKNRAAITDIMEVYTYYYLVTTYGNIPYTQALSLDHIFPVYDDQENVYNDLLTRLDADIDALNTAGESWGNADILYGGDVAKWKLFANSLKLKMGMTIADSDPAKSKTLVESAVASGVFTSNTDNASFVFLASPPNTNPVWEDLVQSGRKDFVACETIIDQMTLWNDPRIDKYFTLDGAGSYSGGGPGRSSDYGTFSKPKEEITLPDAPYLFLDYVEIEFYLAEAIERGYAVGGSAETHYNNAITASIIYWGGEPTDAITYLAQPEVNYTTATGAYQEKIGIQKWIALYNRGWDSWIETRRLDFPKLPAPFRARSVFPVRLTYSVNEQNVNGNNYAAASTAIGGDDVGTKLFWDKF